MVKKPLLCKIGLHKWNRPTYIDHGFHSNVLDWKKKCLKCGKIKRWVAPKKG